MCYHEPMILTLSVFSCVKGANMVSKPQIPLRQSSIAVP